MVSGGGAALRSPHTLDYQAWWYLPSKATPKVKAFDRIDEPFNP